MLSRLSFAGNLSKTPKKLACLQRSSIHTDSIKRLCYIFFYLFQVLKAAIISHFILTTNHMTICMWKSVSNNEPTEKYHLALQFPSALFSSKVCYLFERTSLLVECWSWRVDGSLDGQVLYIVHFSDSAPAHSSKYKVMMVKSISACLEISKSFKPNSAVCRPFHSFPGNKITFWTVQDVAVCSLPKRRKK